MGACGTCEVSNGKPRTIVANKKGSASKNTSLSQTNSDYLIPTSLTNNGDIEKKYKLSKSILGQGASGIVCLGTDKQGKKYAIKRINKLALKYTEGLCKEAEISLSLKHDNIIHCYEVFEDLKTISFVMDIIEGGDLFDFILNYQDGKLSDEVALDLIIQILDTLNYLHNEKAICHRDIKPENFLISIENGKPIIKLIDFGFATFINENEKMMAYLGTPDYTAPEMINREPYTHKIDLWACGVLWFNMLTGCQPFTSNSYIPITEQVRTKPIQFKAIENIKWRRLCASLMERDVEHRYSAVRALNYAKDIKNEFIKLESDATVENEIQEKHCKDQMNANEHETVQKAPTFATPEKIRVNLI